MIPKLIHLCWFSDDPFPVEIKICLASWRRVLPDYTIRRWTYADAMAIDCDCISEALIAGKWAFAADVVRFYAIYKEGGIYMDSDILLEKRFDSFIPEHGFATFNECCEEVLLQAAFFMGEKGNAYCKEVFDYYCQHHFLRSDGSFDMLISPKVMVLIAEKKDIAGKILNNIWKETSLFIQVVMFLLARRCGIPRLLHVIRYMEVGGNTVSAGKWNVF